MDRIRKVKNYFVFIVASHKFCSAHYTRFNLSLQLLSLFWNCRVPYTLQIFMYILYACLDCSSDVIKTTWTLTFFFLFVIIEFAILKTGGYPSSIFWNLQLLSRVTLWWLPLFAGKDETPHRKQSFKIVLQQLGA